MSLYTGINAFKRIKGIEDEVVAATQHYDRMKSFLEYVNSNGSYPSFEYVLGHLNVSDDIEIEDNDKNYYKYHVEFMKLVTKIDYLVGEIDKHSILEKVDEKEVYFTSREHGLAKAFQRGFDSDEFHFRKIVSAEKIQEVIIGFLETVEMNKKFACFEDVFEQMKSIENEYFFEVHVS